MKRRLFSLLLVAPLLTHAALVIEPPTAIPAPAFTQQPDQAFLDDITPGSGRITLTNSDRISGRISHLDFQQNEIFIQHAFSREPIAIARTALHDFEAERTELPSLPASSWSVALSNGDVLCGNIRTIQEETFLLDTWYSGTLSIDRAMVVGIWQHQMADTLYAGPYTADGWQIQGTPQFLGSSIAMGNRSQTSIARELPRFAPKMRVDIEAQWMWQAQIIVRLFAEQAVDQGNTASAYVLNVAGNRISLARQQGGRGSRSFGNANIAASPDESGQFSLSMSIFADVETGRFNIYQNNRPVGEWTDSTPLDITGQNFSIVSQRAHQLVFNTIRISAWDGKLPTDPANRTSDNKQHTFRMQNGDILSGLLTSMQDATAIVETTFGALQIPIERIDKLDFEDQSGIANQSPTAVKIHLLDETVLTLEIESLQDNQIVGVSDNFGSISLPMAGISKIEWSIPEETPEKESTEAAASTPDENMQLFFH